jgi:hypothetical protein
MTCILDQNRHKNSDIDVHSFLQILEQHINDPKSILRDLSSETRAEFDELKNDPMLVLIICLKQLRIRVGELLH